MFYSNQRVFRPKCDTLKLLLWLQLWFLLQDCIADGCNSESEISTSHCFLSWDSVLPQDWLGVCFPGPPPLGNPASRNKVRRTDT